MLLHLRKRRLSPIGRLNLGFITKGKFAAVLITPSSWGSQQCNPNLSKTFWRRCTHQTVGSACSDGVLRSPDFPEAEAGHADAGVCGSTAGEGLTSFFLV